MSQRKTVKIHEAVYFKVWYFKLHVMIALLILMPLIDDIIISLLWRILNALIEVESTITFVLVYPRKLDISYCMNCLVILSYFSIPERQYYVPCKNVISVSYFKRAKVLNFSSSNTLFLYCRYCYSVTILSNRQICSPFIAIVAQYSSSYSNFLLLSTSQFGEL